MSIIIAPDSFKGTYSATQVAAAIAAGVAAAGGTAVELPVADGGEGTLECLTRPLHLELASAECVNPWHAPMTGHYGLTGDGTAVIEVAEASGITTPHHGRRDAITADTYGTGMLIAEAARRGATRIVVAAGGSATTDGGRGAITALHDSDVAIPDLTVLTDVTTTYCDAATVFSPQKGADPHAVTVLTDGLHELAHTLPRNPSEVPGSGAAGGLAGGLWAQFDAQIVPGADFVLDTLDFDEVVRNGSALVVGEGRLDSQTQAGKIISALVRRSAGLPVFAVVGSVGDYTGTDFAEVITATDTNHLRRAGAHIAQRLGVPA